MLLGYDIQNCAQAYVNVFGNRIFSPQLAQGHVMNRVTEQEFFCFRRSAMWHQLKHSDPGAYSESHRQRCCQH